MIEVVDVGNGEIVGYRYSAGERAAALFATSMYRSQLVAGRITDSPEAVQDGLDVTERVKESLCDGLDVIDPRAHAAARTLLLPYLARMHAGLHTPEAYTSVCQVLGVTPYELFAHGMTAQTMLHNPTELEPISFR